MIPMANVFDIDVPPWENKELIELVHQLRKEWDPLFREQMARIMGDEELAEPDDDERSAAE